MPKLYLIPTSITDGNLSFVTDEIRALIRPLKHFIVEEEKTARRFLKAAVPDMVIQELSLYPFNEHSRPQDVENFTELLRLHDVGLVSEAGCPCVADPGAEVVALAHRLNIDVIPLVGPSSILLALMASGLNGQNFAFHGYLPQERTQKIQKIRDLERRSKQEKQTQIFMDTPYRNPSLLDETLSACQPSTRLCIALDLTSSQQFIRTKSVGEWKRNPPALAKAPAVFLILA